MGSQHLPSLTFYAILDPLVRPSQSIVGLDRSEGWEDLCAGGRARARARFNLRGGPSLTFPGPKVWTPTVVFFHSRVILLRIGLRDGAGLRWGRSGERPQTLSRSSAPLSQRSRDALAIRKIFIQNPMLLVAQSILLWPKYLIQKD